MQGPYASVVHFHLSIFYLGAGDMVALSRNLLLFIILSGVMDPENRESIAVSGYLCIKCSS